MKFKTFAIFVAPSILMMLIFIAIPLTSVFIGSFYQTKKVYETVEVESCTASFGEQVCQMETKSQPKLDENGEVMTTTSYVGFENYKNVIEPDRAGEALRNWDWKRFFQIDFWGAASFTIIFTFVTLPLVLFFGLAIALAVNNAARSLKGPLIFISLLPFIITPVVGALSIRWLFVGDGIITAALEAITNSNISMFAQAWTIEILLVFYRTWHVAPFAFVIFYAGLQSVNQDTLESAMIDGASRWERLRYVVIPHLMPLIIFVTLIHLMDTYRAFDEIVGMRAEAYVKSLQYLTYDYLSSDQTGNRSVARASASAMLTMIGIIILLIPVLRRNWRDQRSTS